MCPEIGLTEFLRVSYYEYNIIIMIMIFLLHIIMPNHHTLYYMIAPLMGACMYGHVMYGIMSSAKHIYIYAEVTQETGLGWALRTACLRNVLFSHSYP